VQTQAVSKSRANQEETMYGLNIDPNNPKGDPMYELLDLGVEKVRYTYYDSSGDQLDGARLIFTGKRLRLSKAVRFPGYLTYDTYPNKPASTRLIRLG
jgi:hypothetical protein